MSLSHDRNRYFRLGINREIINHSWNDEPRQRCRLILSWGWRRSQGFGCSPIKKVRELGSDRRKTGWSLSTAGVDS